MTQINRINKKEQHYYKYYFLTILIVSTIGLVDSSYLFYSHYKNYTDIMYSSFCALSNSINCDTVAQSPWSILLGLPIAAWGVIGYITFIIFLIQTRKDEHYSNIWGFIFILSVSFSLFSLYFGYISSSKIKAFCPLCLLSYFINFILTFLVWIVYRRFIKKPIITSIFIFIKNFYDQKILIVSFLLISFLILLLVFFLPHYWQLTPEVTNYAQINTGHTKDGYPWIGAAHPELTIEEFSDYQCFQCAKLHYFLRKIISKYPQKIRLVHRNFPLDHSVNNIVTPKPFHVGSGKLAMLAIFAGTRNKFWQVNDALYSFARDQKSEELYIPDLADQVGIKAQELAWALQSKQVKELLRRDIWEGMKYGITGTPAFVINENVYQGYIPLEILRKIIK